MDDREVPRTEPNLTELNMVKVKWQRSKISSELKNC